MNKSENQRVRLTKRLLKEALIELLENKPLKSITITDICTLAEINRTTFYKYYASEYELYADIENDFLEMIRENLIDYNENGIEKFFSIIKNNPKTAYVLINSNVNDEFPQKIFSIPEIKEALNFNIMSASPHKEYLNSFICNGGYAVSYTHLTLPTMAVV